jgi:hypothetical protein
MGQNHAQWACAMGFMRNGKNHAQWVRNGSQFYAQWDAQWEKKLPIAHDFLCDCAPIAHKCKNSCAIRGQIPLRMGHPVHTAGASSHCTGWAACCNLRR